MAPLVSNPSSRRAKTPGPGGGHHRRTSQRRGVIQISEDDRVQSNVNEFVVNMDRSAYVLSQNDGLSWVVYSRLLEVALYPIWLIRPLTFRLTNAYGNAATFGIKSFILAYHLMMMWLNFIAFMISVSLITVIRGIKEVLKWAVGSEQEQREVLALKKMQEASSFSEWIAQVTKYEGNKRAPGALQPQDWTVIQKHRQRMNRPLSGTNHQDVESLYPSPHGLRHTSGDGDRLNQSNTKTTLTPSHHKNHHIRKSVDQSPLPMPSDTPLEGLWSLMGVSPPRPSSRKRSNRRNHLRGGYAQLSAESIASPQRHVSYAHWEKLPLTVSEWRFAPIQESLYPDLQSFTAYTTCLKQFIGNAQVMIDASSLDHALDDPDVMLQKSLNREPFCLAHFEKTLRLVSSDTRRSTLDVGLLVEVLKRGLAVLREWSVGSIGDQELIFGISFQGPHVEIEEQQRLVVTVLRRLRDIARLYIKHWGASGLDHLALKDLVAPARLEMKSFATSFGSTVLALSGGGRLAIAHIGVMDALEEAECLPNVISGSSGGSVFAALKCCLDDEAYRQCMPRVNSLGKQLFPNLKAQMKNRVELGYNLDYATIARVIRGILGDITFAEAYQKTGKQLCITVTPAFLSSGIRDPVLLGPQSAPDVLIWSAALASCCLPILLPPLRLICKRKSTVKTPKNDHRCTFRVSPSRVFVKEGCDLTDNKFKEIDELLKPVSRVDQRTATPENVGPTISCRKHQVQETSPSDQGASSDLDEIEVDGYYLEAWGPQAVLWSDGSLSCDIPVKELQRLYGASEVVCSQVNPHQAFFLENSPHIEQHALHSGSALDSGLYSMKRFFELGVRQRYNKATSSLLNPYIDGQDITQFFTESGTGTITIAPCAMQDLHKVAKAPKESEIEKACNLARRRTWPHIPRIQYRFKVEEAIRELLQTLMDDASQQPAP